MFGTFIVEFELVPPSASRYQIQIQIQFNILVIIESLYPLQKPLLVDVKSIDRLHRIVVGVQVKQKLAESSVVD